MEQVVIPTQFVLFNLSAILGSAILYGDFRKATFHQFVTFMYGCAATFGGVFIIAHDSGEPYPPKHDEEQGEPTGEDRILGVLVRPGPGPTRRVDSMPVIRSRQSTVSLVGLSPAQASGFERGLHGAPENVLTGGF